MIRSEALNGEEVDFPYTRHVLRKSRGHKELQIGANNDLGSKPSAR